MERYTAKDLKLLLNSNKINDEATYKEIMKEKLNLKLDLMDRRLKDLIDFIVNLNLYYKEGITKKELLDMIDNPEKIKDICNKENQEDCLKQAKTFKPKIIGGMKIEDCITRFFVMLNGLIDNNILDDTLFSDGYWYRK